MLSACVITLNEEKTLGRCLESLYFADEIVVVDSGSTDQTLEVAKAYRAKIISQPWLGFAGQRNRGLKECRGDWIFFIDSDEKASLELGKKLVNISKDKLDSHPNCYSIRRIEYFLGKKLNYGPGNPSHQWRFFKRENILFEGTVHEYPKFTGNIGLIEEPMHHWPDLDIDRFLKKLNHYTTIEALDRFALGQRTSLFHVFGTFFSTFLKNGIRYRGLLNGKEGLILTVLESFSRVVRHLKLWVFWQVYNKKINLTLNQDLPIPGSRTKIDKAELEKPIWDKAKP